MTMTITFRVNGNGFHGAEIPAVEAGIVGAYLAGKPYEPDPLAIQRLLPKRWHAAYLRSGGRFWFNPTGTSARVTLRDYRGKFLTTIYAHSVGHDPVYSGEVTHA